MHEAIVQWKIVVVLNRKKNLWLPPIAPGLPSFLVAALRGQFHFFIPGGAHHPVTDRRVSVQSFTKRLRRAGYVVKSYHPASLGASDPTEGDSLCYHELWYFLPPDNNADYLVKTLKNQTRASWFTPPHYAIVLIGDIFVVSRHP
jgi:hypothetical protein